jgi:hypothetical protein
VKTTAVDFSVKYNIAATTSLKTFASQNEFDYYSCQSAKSKLSSTSPQSLCGYVQTSGVSGAILSTTMDSVVGVAINGVLIMSSSSSFHDPYSPKTWAMTPPSPAVIAATIKAAPQAGESVDSCLGRTTSLGNYHYKMLTPCILEAINVEQGKLCSDTNICKTDK